MAETVKEAAETKILRHVPVEMRLWEVEKDGKAIWIVGYVAVVDGKEVFAPIRHLFGGGDDTPADALKFAATRSEMSI